MLLQCGYTVHEAICIAAAFSQLYYIITVYNQYRWKYHQTSIVQYGCRSNSSISIGTQIWAVIYSSSGENNFIMLVLGKVMVTPVFLANISQYRTCTATLHNHIWTIIMHAALVNNYKGYKLTIGQCNAVTVYHLPTKITWNSILYGLSIL